MQDYVLIQAFKKTTAHLRSHNWFADTLAIDLAATDFPSFLQGLKDRILDRNYAPTPLRIVPAPKSSEWSVTDEGDWLPVSKSKTSAPIRPLAHVELADQVICTALMMCLADRVETAMGSTKINVERSDERRSVIAYGNRLFCEADDHGNLRHRWGSSATYSAYFKDYRAFIGRSEFVAGEIAPDVEEGERVAICHSDLRQFYDRVTPQILREKLAGLSQDRGEEPFFSVASRMLRWVWHKKDQNAVERYRERAGIERFDEIALPQGLVAAGFFSNVVLLDFDNAIQQELGARISPDVLLCDVSRYVDDLRFVVRSRLTPRSIRSVIVSWLQDRLNEFANGARVSEDKTVCTSTTDEQNPLVAQSKKMERIQRQISGGMDAERAQAVLDSINGLVSSQRHYSGHDGKEGWSLAPVPDVRDATVERFAAARFRRTFRSLRPLLVGPEAGADEEQLALLPGTTQSDIDAQARVFAIDLIGSWVADPSNVRLMRIALDLWPDADLIRQVLTLIDQLIAPKTRRSQQRLVGFYCLAEVYRACATETGYVADDEALPSDVDLDVYRAVVTEHATETVKRGAAAVPWYCMQQALLVLAAHGEPDRVYSFSAEELAPYRSVLRLRAGLPLGGTASEAAIYHSVVSQSLPGMRPVHSRGARFLTALGALSPSMVVDLCHSEPALAKRLPKGLRVDLGFFPVSTQGCHCTLADLVQHSFVKDFEADELHLIEFALGFIEKLPETRTGPVAPSEVLLKLHKAGGRQRLHVVRVADVAPGRSGSMFAPPNWVSNEECWKFQLGYLLRYMLIGSPDFSLHPRHVTPARKGYRAVLKHWSIRKLGHFNGYEGLADEWVAVSDRLETLLCQLLQWPGMKSMTSPGAEVSSRVGLVKTLTTWKHELEQGAQTQGGSLILDRSMRQVRPRSPGDEVFRACVLQSVVPSDKFIMRAFKEGDPQLKDGVRRKLMRNHLATALRAVAQMLELRETHSSHSSRLDLLVLPELAVHPDDVAAVILPFVRFFKVAVLAGSTYESRSGSSDLVNAAYWILPSRSAAGGLQVSVFRQGKRHLNKLEQRAVADGVPLVEYRPVQWIINHQWGLSVPPLRLAAAVCYDATDLKLAAALRDRSDVFLVPALNNDVATFDQMATTLSYHMFQYVVVANNGTYGGSNAYTPSSDRFKRQVFHMHGQPQASISMFEIEDIPGYMNRVNSAGKGDYKFPPAGL